jgi:hypothetical protein
MLAVRCASSLRLGVRLGAQGPEADQRGGEQHRFRRNQPQAVGQGSVRRGAPEPDRQDRGRDRGDEAKPGPQPARRRQAEREDGGEREREAAETGPRIGEPERDGQGDAARRGRMTGVENEL